jgi:hypothetical protein
MLGRLQHLTRVIKPTGQQARGMGGGHGHGPPPTYTGIEAKIRAVLPEDYQVSCLIVGQWKKALL